jgi:hypothetical protein
LGAYMMLSSDLQATSITVPSGITLETGGYRIRCQGTCEVDGVIDNSAVNSTTSGVGTPGATGTLGGGAPGVASNGNTLNGSSPVAATLQGGSGGYGGSGVGGTTSASIASPTISTVHTGTLSGGASGGAFSNVVGTIANSGSGGGVVLILCTEIAGSGRISAYGGTAITSGSGIAFAGGGGGGVVIVACYTNTFTGIVTATAGYGKGSSSSNGDSGTAMIMVTV